MSLLIGGLWECDARNNPQASELGTFDPNIIYKKIVTVQSQPPKCYAFRRCGVSAK